MDINIIGNEISLIIEDKTKDEIIEWRFTYNRYWWRKMTRFL